MMPLNRDAILRIIVAVHFVISSLVLMVGWLPASYQLSQAVIIILGLWSIVNRDTVIQVELLMVIKFFSIILDVIAIGMYFQAGRHAYDGNSGYFAFSAFFAILLVILKPVMLLLLNKVRLDRLGGDASPTFGQWGNDGGHVPGYQPVDDSSSSPTRP